MDKIQELKHRIEALWDRCEGLRATAQTERRDLTEAELKEVNGYLDDIDKLRILLVAEERAQQTMNALSEISRVVPPKPEPGRGNGNGNGNGTRSDDDDGKSKWSRFGEMLMAVRSAAMPGGKVDPRLLRAATGLSETVPADGGFLVNKDFSNELLQRTYTVGLLASRVRKIPISSGSNGIKINAVDETSRVDGSRWGGVQAFWQNEADTKVASTPKFRQMTLTLKKLIGLCYATDELLEDAAALEAVIRGAFADEFAFKVDDAILNGPGGGQPAGILTSPALVTVAIESGQTGVSLKYENIVKMWSRLWPRSVPNAVGLINQDVTPYLFTMNMAAGTATTQPVFLPPGGASDAPYGTIFGRPIIPLEQTATAGTPGDILLIDPTQYLLIDKGGMQSATSIHVRFVNDETAFRFVLRLDGQPIWNAALMPYKGANTLSPYVALATRA